MIHDHEVQTIAAGRHGDLFAVLGQHSVDGKITIRAFHPEADKIDVLDAKTGKTALSLDHLGHGVKSRLPTGFRSPKANTCGKPTIRIALVRSSESLTNT